MMNKWRINGLQLSSTLLHDVRFYYANHVFQHKFGINQPIVVKFSGDTCICMNNMSCVF